MLSNSIINKAIDFILLNLENKITVNDVADFCGYSKFYFCHEFNWHKQNLAFFSCNRICYFVHYITLSKKR